MNTTSEKDNSARAKSSFDVDSLRQDFPILHQEINGKPLVYLDNAATTQKPDSVIGAVEEYYRSCNSNVHRGAHTLSDRATREFEHARQKIARFIGSPKPEQVIWTRGTTEAINLVASSWGRSNIGAGDRILVSRLEHHSNIVPWQLLALEKGAEVIPIDVDARGDIDMSHFYDVLDERVKLVAVNHVSNALGTINPIKAIIEAAHRYRAKVVIDGAQAVGHFPIDVAALDCDFYAFSGHKLFGPTGIGVLWGKENLLDAMPPYQGGGEMIEKVSFDGTTFNGLPYKFEAGTPNIAGAIGLGAAVDYICALDRDALVVHEHGLLEYASQKAHEFGSLRIVGQATKKVAVLSFLMEGAHPADVGTLLDQQGIALRTGHHCVQPLMDYYAIPGTVRASFSIYNTTHDIDQLFLALSRVRQLLV